MDDKETLHRRARYRELLRECFGDSPGSLIAHIEARGFKPNQGELSALKKDNGPKSFGDKKAKVLTEQIGLHRRWFDLPIGEALRPDEWIKPSSEPDAGLPTPTRIHQDKPRRSIVADIDDAIRDLEALPEKEFREARLFIKKLVDLVRAKERVDRMQSALTKHQASNE